VIFHKKLGHAGVAIENISTTEPQDSVRGSLMEAAKETKITLIHKLNVKPGVAIVVRNVRYYIYRCQPSFDWLTNYECQNIITGTNRVYYKYDRNITILIKYSSLV
jgi:isocitrate dehydrogenase